MGIRGQGHVVLSGTEVAMTDRSVRRYVPARSSGIRRRRERRASGVVIGEALDAAGAPVVGERRTGVPPRRTRKA
jgi:hypothetical protein